MAALAVAIIYSCEYAVISLGLWKICDKVQGDHVKQQSCPYGDNRHEGRFQSCGVQFGALTCCTSLYVCHGELSYCQPSEVLDQSCCCIRDFWVTGQWMVVVLL